MLCAFLDVSIRLSVMLDCSLSAPMAAYPIPSVFFSVFMDLSVFFVSSGFFSVKLGVFLSSFNFVLYMF